MRKVAGRGQPGLYDKLFAFQVTTVVLPLMTKQEQRTCSEYHIINHRGEDLGFSSSPNEPVLLSRLSYLTLLNIQLSLSAHFSISTHTHFLVFSAFFSLSPKYCAQVSICVYFHMFLPEKKKQELRKGTLLPWLA